MPRSSMLFGRARLFSGVALGLFASVSLAKAQTAPPAAVVEAQPAAPQPIQPTPSVSGPAQAPATAAQSPPMATAGSATSTNEVVVTARRTKENLSNVPVAITAINATAFQERRIETEQDLQSAVPGLTVYGVNSSNSLNFSLRGQSVDAFSFAAPAVLTYINEFSVQSDSASSLYDIDSIQVLKGPQGTLFGRNATGGGILYQTVKPSDTFGGYAKVGYGNYADVKAEGAVNLPLPGNLGAVRLAGQYEKRSGYQDNLLLGLHNGSLDNAGGRASWLFHPIQGLESLTVAQFQYSGGNSVGLKASSLYTPGETNNGVAVTAAIPAGGIYLPGVRVQNAGVAAFGFNGVADFLNKQKGYGFYDLFDAQTNEHRAVDELFTNNTTYRLSDALTIKNVVGFHRSSSHDHTDIDGDPYQPLTIGIEDGAAANGYRYHDEQLSEELQASGKLLNSKLTYLTGVYYFYSNSQTLEQLNIIGDLADPATGAPIPPAEDFLRSFIYNDYSTAAYAQGTYSITDRLHLTLGGRYTSEVVRYNPGQGDLEQTLGVTGGRIHNAKPSWTDSLDYKLTNSLLVYVANRGSWRAGGFNGTSQNFNASGQAVAQSFQPETTYDVELGAKFNGRVFDLPATLDVALYDQHIKNVIRAIYFNDSANSGNVGAAEVKGVEADGSIRPMTWLQLGFATAYTDANYTRPDASIDGVNIVFGPYGDTPRINGSVYARASTKLADDSELVGRIDFYGQSSFFYSNAEYTILPGTQIPSYELVNLRAEWNNIRRSNVSLAGYVTNLGQAHYFTGGFALGAVTGINSVLEGTPRMYGFELSAKF